MRNIALLNITSTFSKVNIIISYSITENITYHEEKSGGFGLGPTAGRAFVPAGLTRDGHADRQ